MPRFDNYTRASARRQAPVIARGSTASPSGPSTRLGSRDRGLRADAVKSSSGIPVLVDLGPQEVRARVLTVMKHFFLYEAPLLVA